MSRTLRAAILAAAAGLLAVPASAQTSLTIYQDGRVLVRRVVELEVARGESRHRVPGPLDPASLISLDSSVVIVAARYDGAEDERSALRRAIGRRILFLSGKDTLRAVVRAVDPTRFELPDGSIAWSLPGTPLYPKDLVPLDPVLDLTLRSDRARRGLALGYFTGGARWEASYQVLLGNGSARVQGAAVIVSDALAAQEAEVQLLAGDVSRAKDDRMRPSGRVLAQMVQEEAVGQQRVGEFHVYTLPGRHALVPGAVTTAALFDPASAPYERRYVVRGRLPYYGAMPPMGDEEDVPVEVSYRLTRARKTQFGDRPLPGGTARLYRTDDAGRLQLVGEAGIGHTPAGEALDLAAGTAFDLTAKRVQSNYTTAREERRTVATADYRVTIANATDSAASVEVIEERAGEWSVVQSSVTAERLSATRTRFRVAVPAAGSATLTYRVRVVW